MFRKISSFLTAAALTLLLGISIAPPADAGASSTYLINKIYASTFQNTGWTGPASVYVALGTGGFVAGSCTTEVSAGNYARVAVAANSTQWPISGGTISNANAITFASGGVTGTWGLVNQFCVYDASTSGNLLISALLTTAQQINNGQAGPTFAPGALTWTVQ